jgi:tetratricopeptide (TPR) repeat protein
MRARLVLVLLLVICFSLATRLQPSRRQSEQSTTALALLFGDTRKMFARQFFAKADAYFHRGKYPSIFDQQNQHEENHIAGEAHHHDGDNDDEKEQEPAAQDWIQKFQSHFHPSVHVHLAGSEEQEMLPWLRISADLDPHQIEAFTTGAYWLERLNKIDDAEQFLREGLRSNRGSPELLYELGRLTFQYRKDMARAQTLFSVALRRWNEVEKSKKEPDIALKRNILAGLAEVAMQQKRTDEAIEFFKQLKEVSPHPESVQKRIDELSASPLR